MLAIAAEILSRLGLAHRFVIAINDVEIFNGIADNLALDSEARNELRRLMDIRAAADLKRFLSQYASAAESSAFADLVQLSGKAEIFEKARDVITNRRSRTALDRLAELWRVIDSLGMADDFEIDLGDVPQLGYYTGLTFSIYVRGAGARVGGGGRYDNLTHKFGKAEPAIGFVLTVDSLTELLADRTESAQAGVDAQQITPGDSEIGSGIGGLFNEALKRRAVGQKICIDAYEEKAFA
jgi:ATP phosphoribosyltransferase regulatory subunit